MMGEGASREDLIALAMVHEVTLALVIAYRGGGEVPDLIKRQIRCAFDAHTQVMGAAPIFERPVLGSAE